MRSATGLPPGLTINLKTGLISGRPTKVGTFPKIKIAATNGVTPKQVAIPDQSIEIVAMPTGLEGSYTGLVGREAAKGRVVGVVAGYARNAHLVQPASEPLRQKERALYRFRLVVARRFAKEQLAVFDDDDAAAIG